MNQEQNNFKISNGKSSKKRNVSLILGIFGIIAILAGVILLCFGDKKTVTGGNSVDSGNKNNSEQIVQIYTSSEQVVALTESGNLYVVQDQYISDYYGEGVPAVIEKPMIVAKNVKKFFGDGTAYVDFDANLYRAGLNPIDGGYYDEYIKLGTNIKEADNAPLGLLAVSNDGELYIYGHTDFYIGANNEESVLTQLQTDSNNIVDVELIYSSWTTYLTSDGELFVRGYGEAEFKKELDNVSKIDEQYITKDDVLYEVDYYGDGFEIIERSNDNPKGYPEDIKELLYESYDFLDNSSNSSSDGYVYINDSNKIVLYDYTEKTVDYEDGLPVLKIETDIEELDNTVGNMNKILKFIQKYTY